MSSHSFSVEIATEYKSVDIAILVSHIQYWIIRNKRLGRNQIDGRTWTYQTNLEIASSFPYWSIYQVERLIKKAIELKILRKANYNKSKFDRTAWYAFEDEQKFGISRFDEMEEVETENGNNGIADSNNKDTDPITDVKKDNMSESQFGRIASSFFSRLKEVNRKINKPNLKKWAKELELLSKDGDGNTIEEIEKVIEYVLGTRQKPAANGFCWAKVILCPSSLRKKFPRLWDEMHSQGKDVNTFQAEEDKKLAEKIWNKVKVARTDISLGFKYLEFINGPRSTLIEFGTKDFKNKCLEQLYFKKIHINNL